MSTATDLQNLYSQNIMDLIRYQTVTEPMAKFRIATLANQRDRGLNNTKIGFERGKTALFSPVEAAGLENSGAAGVHVGNYLADNARKEAEINASFEEARQQILAELAAERAYLGLAGAQANINALQTVGGSAAGGLA